MAKSGSKTPKVQVVSVKTSDLRPNEYNPNRQSDEAFELLLKSIKEDGFTMPIIVNDGSKDPKLRNMIVDGEHRWRAALVLGLREVPVVYLPLDEAAMKVSTIRHNRATGHHDALLDAVVLKQIMDGGATTEDIKAALGLDEVEIDLALQALSSFDEDDVDELNDLIEDEEEKFDFVGDEGVQEMIAKRRAVARRLEAVQEETREQGERERLNTVRIDMRFTHEQADVVEKVVKHFGSFADALRGVMDWAIKAGKA